GGHRAGDRRKLLSARPAGRRSGESADGGGDFGSLGWFAAYAPPRGRTFLLAGGGVAGVAGRRIVDWDAARKRKCQMKEKHPTTNIQHRTPNGGVGERLSAIGCWLLDAGCWMLIFFISVCPAAYGATNAVAIPEVSAPPTVTSENPRELYNAGTEKLRAGKLSDAETLLESSLTKQDERVQPAALFNLGHVRFAQGNEELKKAPAGATKRGWTAAEAGAGAIQK